MWIVYHYNSKYLQLLLHLALKQRTLTSLYHNFCIRFIGKTPQIIILHVNSVPWNALDTWVPHHAKESCQLDLILSSNILILRFVPLCTCMPMQCRTIYLITLYTFTNNYTFILCHRLQLAAMHYNENSERMQSVTLAGRPRYAIRFPKSKKGGYVVRAEKTRPTYGMWSSLVKK